MMLTNDIITETQERSHQCILREWLQPNHHISASQTPVSMSLTHTTKLSQSTLTEKY